METWRWVSTTGTPIWREDGGGERSVLPATHWSVGAVARTCEVGNVCYTYDDVRIDGSSGGAVGKAQAWKLRGTEDLAWGFDANDPRFGEGCTVMVTP